ncbi:MAG: MarR family winged helix-turn-helix transcriptional regulator [Opitutaceae bacterium]
MNDQISLQNMHVLANSIRRTYNRLRHVTDQIHAESGLSAPKRTLLMDIDRDGAQTVPKLAASRYVSRQIIQTQVNELTDGGYLKTKKNPEHKRSSLIDLTASGRNLVKTMQQSESAFINELGWLPESEDLSTCQRVLDEIYGKLPD